MNSQDLKVFQPTNDRISHSSMTKYQLWLKENGYFDAADYESLHKWSVKYPNKFWTSLINYFNIDYTGNLEPAYSQLSFFDYPWFPNVKLNFAKNLLKYAKSNSQNSALHFLHESNVTKVLSYQQVYSQTYQLQQYLKPLLRQGDVVAAYMPNCPETVISMLGATSLGMTFTSTSCDFGIQGVVDRFSQSRPRILVMATGYEYNGKYFDLTSKVLELKEALPSVEKIILVEFLKPSSSREQFSKAKFIVWWDKIVDENKNYTFDQIEFEHVSFSHPLYIMYSSGTTGKPKCILHSVGGTLLQHLKEIHLHYDVTPKKKIFFFTTCGWMMWNWLVSSLALGAEVFLFDGSPAHPTLNNFMDKIAEHQFDIWGTSPKFLRALETSQWKKSHEYKSLSTIISTGAPLLPEQYDYVQQNISATAQLSSMSGGTDIISCFMLGNPNLPVYRGQIQCLGLGMNVASFDEHGQEVVGVEGELVCKTPFVSQPIGFLNDCNDEKYRESYFSKFPNVWHHGDYISLLSNGGVKVYGRSDTTLNPGGVRIGTGEIYRQTEKIPWIEDALCVAKNDGKGDVDIVLFIKTRQKNLELSAEHIKEVKNMIRVNTTPRHVPKWVVKILDIPYTRSGKKMEMSINKLLNGRDVGNMDAVANPECFAEYHQLLQKGVFKTL